MPNLGPTELIIILVIIVAIFGAGKLANLGGALGKGVSDFRSAFREASEDDEAGEAGADTDASSAAAGPKPEAAETKPESEES